MPRGVGAEPPTVDLAGQRESRVAEEAPHVLHAGAALEQQGREGVAEGVRGEVRRQPGRLRALLEGLPPPGVGVVAAHIGAEHVLRDRARCGREIRSGK